MSVQRRNGRFEMNESPLLLGARFENQSRHVVHSRNKTRGRAGDRCELWPSWKAGARDILFDEGIIEKEEKKKI